MPDITLSLFQFAQIADSNAVSGMARTVGLKWPPPPTISLRNLIELVGQSFYVTQHYDNSRIGWMPFEQTLTAETASNVKLLFGQPLDDTVFAQPLYMRNVSIPGKGSHNVVFIATLKCSVYAFDADGQSAPLWQQSLVPQGEVPRQYNPGSGDINWGIISTPVISPSAGTLYVVSATQPTQSQQVRHRLHALDIGSGQEKPGSPVQIEATFPFTPPVQFIDADHMNRPGLLLHNGILYIAFGTFEETVLPYHGWVMAYKSANLQPVGVFCTSPNSSSVDPADAGAGIWQSGMGLAADSDGFIYFATGNGLFNADTPGGESYGDSVVKLSPSVTVADYFTPCNQANLSTATINGLPVDQDLGSGGVMLLPHQSGLHPKLLVACGKEGTIYVIDRTNMGKGKSSQPSPDPNSICDDPIPPLVDRLVRVVGGSPTNVVIRDAVFGGPTYFEDQNRTQRIYYCGSYPLDPPPPTPAPDPLKAFILDANSGTLNSSPEVSTDKFGGEGGSIPVVSSNGDSDGIVWLINRENWNLVAYAATDLTQRLLTKLTASPRHPVGYFLVPTVMNGKVYVGGNQLFVFGFGK